MRHRIGSRAGGWSFVVAFVLTAVACAPSRPPTSERLASLLEACTDFRTALEARELRCRFREERAQIPDALCVRLLSASGVQVDVARVGSCGERLRDLPCDQVLADEVECRPFLFAGKGLLANGARCNVDNQCVFGRCAGGGLDFVAGSLGCGVCRDRTANGQPCTSDEECDVEGRCGIGEPRVCTAPLVEGEACGTGTVCRQGAFCDPRTKKCERAPRLGETCRFSRSEVALCANGLPCVDGRCALPLAIGDACDGSSGQCGEGLSCNLDPPPPWRCETNPVHPDGPQRIPEGIGCKPGVAVCEAFLTCSSVSRRCVVPELCK